MITYSSATIWSTTLFSSQDKKTVLSERAYIRMPYSTVVLPTLRTLAKMTTFHLSMSYLQGNNYEVFREFDVICSYLSYSVVRTSCVLAYFCVQVYARYIAGYSCCSHHYLMNSTFTISYCEQENIYIILVVIMHQSLVREHVKEFNHTAT